VDAVSLEELARRVARLEAIEIAKVTAARYGRACDTKDVDALRQEIFTPDAVLRLPNREEHGVDAIAKSYAAAFAAEPGIRRHFMINHVAEVDDDGVVHMDSYFFFVSQDRDSVIGWGAYRDVIVIDDGVGRIRDKTILVDVYSTLDAGWALGDQAGAV
jgi:hypothetical protein